MEHYVLIMQDDVNFWWEDFFTDEIGAICYADAIWTHLSAYDKRRYCCFELLHIYNMTPINDYEANVSFLDYCDRVVKAFK